LEQSELELWVDRTISAVELRMEGVKRFGRVPHRNKVLGRTSTKEEQEFLKHATLTPTKDIDAGSRRKLVRLGVYLGALFLMITLSAVRRH